MKLCVDCVNHVTEDYKSLDGKTVSKQDICRRHVRSLVTGEIGSIKWDCFYERYGEEDSPHTKYNDGRCGVEAKFFVPKIPHI